MDENIEAYYTSVQNKDATWQGIGLTEKAGKYQGVVYRYGEVAFADEENPDGSLNLSFDWEMLDSNGLPEDSFKDDFKTLIGDILVNIIETHVKEGTLVYDDRGDNTNTTDMQ